MIEITTPYTLADHINLTVKATVFKKDKDYIIDELETFHDGNRTDISRLQVYRFANVNPISVEDDIINLVLSKVHD